MILLAGLKRPTKGRGEHERCMCNLWTGSRMAEPTPDGGPGRMTRAERAVVEEAILAAYALKGILPDDEALTLHTGHLRRPVCMPAEGDALAWPLQG